MAKDADAEKKLEVEIQKIKQELEGEAQKGKKEINDRLIKLEGENKKMRTDLDLKLKTTQ